MKNTITATMVLLILVSAGCIGTEEKSNMIGGDRDEHGCLIAAGFSWNESAQKCMRPWSGEVQNESGNIGMPNPAAVYCKNMGYEYRTATDADGSQRGECKVDGRWVDEWTLYRNASREDVETIGGDQDEHGCYLAAGYSWCNEKQKCVRSWEENCSDYTIAKTTGERCTKDTDCVTPGEYLMLSHCPYTSKCIEGKCAVICPFPFTPSKPGEDGGVVGGGTGMANPAAVYCRDKGYDYRIVTDADGGQKGECKTKEGVWVDEWALYNKEIDSP